MLGRDHDGGAANHLTVLVVLHGDLTLAVGTDPLELAALADLSQPPGETVGQGDGSGHEFGSLVAGVAEHHALVAGAHQIQGIAVAPLLDLIGLVDAHGDVRRLLIDGSHDSAGAVVKAIGGIGVADALHGAADDGGNVGVVAGGDLTHDRYHTGGGEGLTGHVGMGIAGQDVIQNSVRDLVTDFVRMSFGNRLRGEYAVAHKHFLSFFRWRRKTATKKRSHRRSARDLTLIFRTLPPDLAPCGLPQVAGLHRAVPSATLDKVMELYLHYSIFVEDVKAP